jgi:hypothetical protein
MKVQAPNCKLLAFFPLLLQLLQQTALREQGIPATPQTLAGVGLD